MLYRLPGRSRPVALTAALPQWQAAAKSDTLSPMKSPVWFCCALSAVGALGQDDAAVPEVEEIVVVADGSVRARQGDLGSVTTVDSAELDLLRANHVHETLVRVPGVWVQRGSGHEHLTAIRSGVLAGPGACGEFLYLENGIPIRPAGFCNINNLFEVNTEQAAAVEVVRGPASALFGGNALHGVVNVVGARAAGRPAVSLEVGPYDYHQVRAGGAAGDLRLDVHSTSSGGYRDDTGFGQQKASLSHAFETGSWAVSSFVTATLLNQETGGFVRGYRAYDDGDLRDTNPNPEAYRDAWSVRAISEWARDLGGRQLVVTPYLRRSRMAFFQHFLPGQPLETNAQTSGGAVGRLGGVDGRLTWNLGAQIEWMRGELREHQDGPTLGSAFLVATRPRGTHYDYDVDSSMAAAFYDLNWSLAGRANLVHSLRVERLAYKYDNNATVGNTRDDGTGCGFGGCLYTRPASRDDAFTDVAGRLGVHWNLADASEAYAVLGRGFRAPQATELYRLQSGQTVADIDSEALTSFEVGWRRTGGTFDADIAVYAERTDHLIFRDANGFNVSDGETESSGVEFTLRGRVGDAHRLELTGTWARHRYAFDRDAARGERIRDGNDVDTAPRWLGSARWHAASGRFRSELEAVYVGSHFLNAANTARYKGHLAFHWRGSYRVSDRMTAFARLLNVTDERYADRADFAFGSYRYFPALPRQFYLGVEVTW